MNKLNSLIRILILGLAATLSLSSTASAISQADLHAVNYDTVFYDPNATGNCTILSSIDLSGSDNAQKSFNYFLSKSLPAFQVAAIVANFEEESSINPTKNEQGGGAGRGIAQWGVNGRWVVLNKFAASRSLDPLALSTQLQFAWAELSEDNNGSYSALKATTNFTDATTVFMNLYEQPNADPAINHIAKRIQFAQTYLRLYGGAAATAASGGTTVSVPSGGCDSITGPGQDTQFVNGFTIYYQTDPTWSNKPYGSSTIGVSGCGPTAMATIITNLTGKSVTPDVTAAYAQSAGLYVPGVGTSSSVGPILARHWGLKSALLGADIAKITAALQAGSLVIVSGTGPEPFTSAGHFIVIRGVNANGQWLLGDPYHKDANTKGWDPKQILVSMDNDAYAISK